MSSNTNARHRAASRRTTAPRPVVPASLAPRASAATGSSQRATLSARGAPAADAETAGQCSSSRSPKRRLPSEESAQAQQARASVRGGYGGSLVIGRLHGMPQPQICQGAPGEPKAPGLYASRSTRHFLGNGSAPQSLAAEPPGCATAALPSRATLAGLVPATCHLSAAQRGNSAAMQALQARGSATSPRGEEAPHPSTGLRRVACPTCPWATTECPC